MAEEIYYLSSLESTRLAPVRECKFERHLTFDTGKAAVEAKMTPGVIGQEFDRASDIETVILTARHEGASVDAIVEFPCFVFVAIPRPEFDVVRSPLRTDDLVIIGWGELYRTHEDAERHAFG